LLALAITGHFGRAAKACHLTQSALNASIKETYDASDVRKSAAVVAKTARFT
jgi:hypothetical protein